MSNLVLNKEAKDAIELTPTDRTSLDKIRGDKLVQLACANFDSGTTEAEFEVLRVSASVVDPELPKEGSERAEIRPEFLRWLLTDPEAAPCIAPKGIRVFYCTITGGLDLYGYRINFPVTFWLSKIEGHVNIQSAETLDLFVMNSEVNGTILGDRADIKGSLILRNSRICGGVAMGGARITGDLDCLGAELLLTAAPEEIVSQGNAFNVSYAEIGGSVVCRNAFLSAGAICLSSSKVGKDLMFFGSRLGNVDCRGLQLSGDLLWLDVTAAKNDDEKAKSTEGKNDDADESKMQVKLDASGASIGVLHDDYKSWPSAGMLVLDGCIYKGLLLHQGPKPEHVASNRYPSEADSIAGQRIDWLMRQSPADQKKPQPWLQLAAYLDSKGEHREAKHVLYRMKRLDGATDEQKPERRWSPELWSDLRDIFSVLFHLPSCLRHPIKSFLIAFAWLEEVPFRICWSIGVFLLAGTVIFGYAASQRALAPTDDKAYEAFNKGAELPGTYPKLNPLIYTLENAVPLAKMGQDEKWAPDPHDGVHDPSRPWKSVVTNYEFLMTIRWLLILSGWFQAAVLAAALSGLFKE
jgi:hypothetical protein